MSRLRFFEYHIFGDRLLFLPEAAQFSLTEEDLFDTEPLPSVQDLSKLSRTTTYSFCLNLIDACNLNCDYCFNTNKSGHGIRYDEAVEHLQRLFSLFPNGEKYIVDLSGKGEPLLLLKDILRISDWCHAKQNEIRKEVLVQFVSNGTLLSPSVAATLQNHGILFGVSLDGDKVMHDKHRKAQDGSPTYDVVLNNVRSIQNRDYVGCAGTITREVFPLLETIRDLIGTFKTISFRPVRGKMRIDSDASVLWQKEYERLAEALYKDALINHDSMFFALMNGDDYFGRFLCRAFGGQIVINRCDGGISRFCIDEDGKTYPCPAATSAHLSIEEDLLISSKETLDRQTLACKECPFKLLCGGECLVELSELGKPSLAMCDLKKKLILLANWLERRIFSDNPLFHERLVAFVEEKMMRFRRNVELETFMNKRPDLSFSEAKKFFDESNKKY